jgi:ABC-type phosphate/phosphonate transport system permease subunit
MTITLGLTPLVSLLAGVLILVAPRLLNYIVAIYLIVIGLIGLFGVGNMLRKAISHEEQEEKSGIRIIGGWQLISA